MRHRFLPLFLLPLLPLFLASCAWLAEHAAKPTAPAAAYSTNATAAELPRLPAFPAQPGESNGLVEKDLDEPNPPGTRQKFGKRDNGADNGKAAGKAKAPAGKTTEQCYSKTPKSKKGRCEPQCVPYARCRTGIDSCRLGRESNSLTWFACEKKHRNTTDEPGPGMVMVLLANARRNMPTGHCLVVEKATPQGKDAWLLVVSHANWDTHCALEANARVLYNRKTMKAAFLSGEWKDWASDLAVAGFIEK